MDFLKKYVRQRRAVVGFFALCTALFAVTFALYDLPLSAVLYPAALCALVLIGGAAWSCWREHRVHRELTRLQSLPDDLHEALTALDGLRDEDYRALIGRLLQREREQRTALAAREADGLDYYTTWVHQIKTPIASMRLTLQGEDTPLSRSLSGDLFRIEQYADMVLAYLRLEPNTGDYVFQKQSLDAVVRGSVKKFAGQFIARGLHLHYAPTDHEVVTDEKWLAFVIEQLLSNALKYTPQGSITVEMSAPDTLCIRDTGIGIAPEDLPRIFDKGYTGHNGRLDHRASGLGLYLCRRVCDNLGCTLTAQSTVAQGTAFYLRFDAAERQYE